MVALKVRQATVCAATGLFFVVAAASQLQGTPLLDSMVKSLISCMVLVALGLALVRIVEEAERKDAQAARAPRSAPAHHAGAPDAGE